MDTGAVTAAAVSTAAEYSCTAASTDFVAETPSCSAWARSSILVAVSWSAWRLATKMELRAQAEQLGAAAQTSLDTALQGYSVGVQLAAADVDAPMEAPQVNVQA